MNILLFGSTGQVGWELERSLATLGDVISLHTQSTGFCGDFTNIGNVIDTIYSIKPDIIVNASAYTAVDKAEENIKLAEVINSNSVLEIAKAANSIGALFVHYSTDYVYSGSGNNYWCESDLPAPLNIYGKTKLEGELAVIANCKKYLIFRTSWVYGLIGTNFIKTMLKYGRNNKEISIINDQYGAPTGADLLADCTLQAIKVVMNNSALSGVYNLAASGVTTWYDYALFIFEEAKTNGLEIEIDKINAINSDEYKSLAKRPTNSRLSTNKLQETFGLYMPHWKNGVRRMIKEYSLVKNGS
ncbi:TPA: dTDP-4-dehydrorhamnose reductase [Citrobacter sedlakii]